MTAVDPTPSAEPPAKLLPWPRSLVFRYLVFSGTTFFPAGGWRDFKGSFADQQTALIAAEMLRDDWVQVVDLDSGELLYDRGDAAGGPTHNTLVTGAA